MVGLSVSRLVWWLVGHLVVQVVCWSFWLVESVGWSPWLVGLSGWFVGHSVGWLVSWSGWLDGQLIDFSFNQ